MKRLALSPSTKSDLEEIAGFISRDNPLRAASFVSELIAKRRAISRHPRIYAERPELGVRKASYGRYLIFFRETAREVRIERIIHSARDLPKAWNTR